MAVSPVRLRASMSVGSADTIAFTRSNSPALIASMKAAVLALLSGIGRFYLAAMGPTARALAALVVCCTASAYAQAPDRPPLGSSITIEALGLLPASDNLFS